MREDAGSDALFEPAFYADRTVFLDMVSPSLQEAKPSAKIEKELIGYNMSLDQSKMSRRGLY
ncbi:hypothetical protein H9L39_17993 [Fusarium oxysporum f. sp. albedinis]|nr:hypothetical protein H9L39_17993 [Fusarium oxysporum f. sp. albedinis]